MHIEKRVHQIGRDRQPAPGLESAETHCLAEQPRGDLAVQPTLIAETEMICVPDCDVAAVPFGQPVVERLDAREDVPARRITRWIFTPSIFFVMND